jgi:diguanylate cyclase (GGDEF)-like protein
VGDQLLIEAANRLSQSVRQSDTLARNGGDEFILLQPGVNAGDASTIASKLEAMMDRPFMIEGHSLQISASVGCAVFPQDVNNVEAVINLADSRMYERKQEKRARQS